MVLFASPAEQHRLAGIQYDPNEYTMEYLDGQLPGLTHRVESRQYEPEVVQIDGIQYVVTNVTNVHDGLTHRANLVPDTNIESA